MVKKSVYLSRECCANIYFCLFTALDAIDESFFVVAVHELNECVFFFKSMNAHYSSSVNKSFVHNTDHASQWSVANLQMSLSFLNLTNSRLVVSESACVCVCEKES